MKPILTSLLLIAALSVLEAGSLSDKKSSSMDSDKAPLITYKVDKITMEVGTQAFLYATASVSLKTGKMERETASSGVLFQISSTSESITEWKMIQDEAKVWLETTLKAGVKIPKYEEHVAYIAKQGVKANNSMYSVEGYHDPSGVVLKSGETLDKAFQAWCKAKLAALRAAPK